MTDEPRDENTDDVEWLKNAFERANQGDNGTVSEAPRVTPAPFDDSPRRHDLDLDFETENTPPVTSFELVKIPKTGDATSASPIPPVVEPVAADNPATEVLDSLEIPDATEPKSQPDATETTGIDRLGALFSRDEPQTAATTVLAANSDDHDTTETTDVASRARLRRVLILVAGSLVIAIAAIGSFLTGRLIATPAPIPTPTPTMKPAPTEARPAGDWAYGELFGGECLATFDGPWSETFTVVDCSQPHEAQLVYAGDLALDGNYPSYPGDQHVGDAASAECQRKGILDLTTAVAYTNLLISVAYPISEDDWNAGETRYYCFASRKGGDLLSESIAGSALSRSVESTPGPSATP